MNLPQTTLGNNHRMLLKISKVAKISPAKVNSILLELKQVFEFMQ
jgi:hypothetical protein